MRRPLTFACQGATLAGVLHPATGTTGVVIVSGGVQTRAGSHRGFVALADRLAAAGYPTLRFDRRGVGDSDGDDPGFRAGSDDIAAAVAELRAQYPQLKRVVGWGLCDGASALALNAVALGLEGIILANPWTRDSDGGAELPPPAAVAARYRERLASPAQWARLLRGGFDLRKAVRGLLSLACRQPVPALAHRLATGLQRYDRPVLVLLSARDATAQAFAALWRAPPFAVPRARRGVEVATIADAAHTFARREDAAAMADRCLEWLAQRKW